MGKKITIVGCGPGAMDLMTLRGQRAIEIAGIIVGSKRLLENLPPSPCPLPEGEGLGEGGLGNSYTFKFTKSDVISIVLKDNYQETLEEVDRIKSDKNVVFLVSGDPLFHSFGISIIKKFGKEYCKVIPGVSSFQYAFSLLKENWEDYKVLSLHGKVEVNLDNIFEENEKLLLLLDPEHNLKYIKRLLKSPPDSNRQFYVASNLSLPTENIARIYFDDFKDYPEESLSILIVNSA